MKHSTTLGLLIVAMAALCVRANAELYLASGIQNPSWSGNCSASCPVDSPCGSASDLSLSDGPCYISIINGNYSSTPLYWGSTVPINVSITFLANVTNLDLKLTVLSGDATLRGNSSGTLWKSRIEVSNMASTISVSNLTFFETAFINSGGVNSAAISFLEVSSCAFGAIASTSGITSLVSSQTNISLTDIVVETKLVPFNFPLVSLISNGSISFNRVTGNCTQLFNISPQEITAEILNSRLEFTKFSSVDLAYQKLTISNSSLQFLGGTDFRALRARQLAIHRSFLTNLQIDSTGNFASSDTSYTDCSFIFGSSTRLTFDRVTIDINTIAGQLVVSSPLPRVHLLRDLQVKVNPQLVPFSNGPAPFTISGGVVLALGSSLTTNRLWLEYNSSLQVDYLTVTEFISCVTCQTSPSTIIATQNSIWNFDSVQVNNVTIAFDSLSEFHYRATNPPQGILLRGISTFRIPNKVILSWPNTVPFLNNTWYPLANSALSNPSLTFVPSSSITEDVDIISNYAAIEATAYFKFLPKVYCPPPPVGFTCVQGIWVADGSGNSTTTVVVPGNGGTVQVSGNLTVSGPIVFKGPGSSLNVSGCVNIPSVEIEIDPSQEVPSTPVVLIQQGTDCRNSLGSTIVSIIQPSQSCKKVSAKNNPTSQTSLIVTFAVDGSKCSKNWRWIVLGTVLGVAALVALAAVIIWKLTSTNMKIPHAPL